MNEFQRPMSSWSGLEPFGRHMALARSGLKLFVYELGEPAATPLVMIHGLGDDADTWRHVIRPLAQSYRVIALDLPGFGRSDKPKLTYSLRFLRDTVLDLVDTLNLPRMSLLGHSLGAIISQYVALSRPASIIRLWLVSGSLTAHTGKPNPILVKMSLPWLGVRMYNALRRDPQAAYESLRPFYARLDSLPKTDRDFLFQRVNERVWNDDQRDALLSVVRQMVWLLPWQQHAQEARLARLAVPTRVLWGGLDEICSPDGGRTLVSIQDTASLTILPDTGHSPHQEQPEALLTYMGIKES
jgi:pimeloyl-ACP methyl ester carboxylesterase